MPIQQKLTPPVFLFSDFTGWDNSTTTTAFQAFAFLFISSLFSGLVRWMDSVSTESKRKTESLNKRKYEQTLR